MLSNGRMATGLWGYKLQTALPSGARHDGGLPDRSSLTTSSEGVNTVPMTKKNGKPKKSELPSTLKKSGKKAQRTFAKAHDAAAKEYGDAERAHRVAYSALKHKFEKVGDRWEKKDNKGPSDERARSGGPNAKGKTAEGVNAKSTKKHLAEVARKLDISGRSSMNKNELVTAIKKANRRETARNR